MSRIYGWKFLTLDGCTYHDNKQFDYNLPARGERWSGWTEHPTPAQADGNDCGEGRLHLMRKPDARYAPTIWWPWFAEGEILIGESLEKIAVARVRLRRVSRKAWWRFVVGKCAGANLTGAYLTGANLTGAYLTGAYLTGAYLTGAYLTGANLTGAYLTGANLTGANLTGANLTGAYLTGADLTGANLGKHDLDELRKRGAIL